MMKGLLLTVVLLGLIAYSQAWGIRSRSRLRSRSRPISRPSPKSQCTYYRSSLRLVCYSTWGSSSACNTVQAKGSSDRNEDGPTPRGRYLIGVMYDHKDRDWYNLYPKERYGSGYYDYYRKNPDTGRSHIALHPGTLSLGCVTVTSNDCWRNIRDQVNTGSASKQWVSASWGRKKLIYFVGQLDVV